MTETEEAEWQERLRLAVEATLRARAKRKAERLQRQAQRDWGLRQRYALKTARIRIATRREE